MIAVTEAERPISKEYGRLAFSTYFCVGCAVLPGELTRHDGEDAKKCLECLKEQDIIYRNNMANIENIIISRDESGKNFAGGLIASRFLPK